MEKLQVIKKFGGIIGRLDSNCTVSQCYNLKKVRATASGDVGAHCGGLIGVTELGHLIDSYNCGNVSSAGNNVGGLVGFLGNAGASRWADIFRCYSTVITVGNKNAGSFVGWASRGQITNCVSTTSQAYIGGWDSSRPTCPGCVTQTSWTASSMINVLGSCFSKSKNNSNNELPILLWQIYE